MAFSAKAVALVGAVAALVGLAHVFHRDVVSGEILDRGQALFLKGDDVLGIGDHVVLVEHPHAPGVVVQADALVDVRRRHEGSLRVGCTALERAAAPCGSTRSS
jgi:hypothetical protein